MNLVKPDPKLLEVLACPVTKGPLRYNEETNELISLKANLAFPIEEGTPILLVERAREIDV